MRRFSIFLISSLLLLDSCNSEKKDISTKGKVSEQKKKAEITLIPCGTQPRDAFKILNNQLALIDNTDSLIISYKVHLDSLILNWDSLVSAENFQITSISKTLDQITTHQNHNSAKVNEIKNALCLVESNRLPADEIDNSERMALFDHLLDTLMSECRYQVLDLANIPHNVDNKKDQYIDPDSLITLIGDSIITEHIYAAETQDNIIMLNGRLYLESATTYNQFIETNRVALESKGLKGLKQFPGFYE
jgi:hypothetical protein